MRQSSNRKCLVLLMMTVGLVVVAYWKQSGVEGRIFPHSYSSFSDLPLFLPHQTRQLTGNCGMKSLKGGKATRDCRFPFALALVDRSGTVYCGAVHINENQALTAAHCVEKDSAGGPQKIVRVRSGCPCSQITTAVASPHPSYQNSTFAEGNDIAILWLTQKLAGAQPVKLPEKGYVPSIGENLTVVSWKNRSTLEHLELAVMNAELCSHLWSMYGVAAGLWRQNGGPLLCAGNEYGDACRGSSGSPVVSAYAPDQSINGGQPGGDVLVALTSYGSHEFCNGRANKATPGVYVLVEHHLEWILEQQRNGQGHPTPSPGSSPTPSEGELEKALLQACKDQNFDRVKELLDEGADVNARDGHLRTLLILAAREGAVELVELAISYGADVDAQANDGWTALHFAAYTYLGQPVGHLRIAELLIKAGADVNIRDNDGKTPLSRVQDRGGSNTAMAYLLREHGAQP